MEAQQVESLNQHSRSLHCGTCHPQVAALAVITRLRIVAVTHLGHLGHLLVFNHMDAEAFGRHLWIASQQTPHADVTGGVVENLLVTAFISKVHCLAHLCRHRVVYNLSL